MEIHPELVNESIEDIIIGALNNDSGHHKQWYLDQLLRKLIPEQEYQRRFRDPDYGDWDTGIIP